MLDEFVSQAQVNFPSSGRIDGLIKGVTEERMAECEIGAVLSDEPGASCCFEKCEKLSVADAGRTLRSATANCFSHTYW